MTNRMKRGRPKVSGRRPPRRLRPGAVFDFCWSRLSSPCSALTQKMLENRQIWTFRSEQSSTLRRAETDTIYRPRYHFPKEKPLQDITARPTRPRDNKGQLTNPEYRIVQHLVQETHRMEVQELWIPEEWKVCIDSYARLSLNSCRPFWIKKLRLPMTFPRRRSPTSPKIASIGRESETPKPWTYVLQAVPRHKRKDNPCRQFCHCYHYNLIAGWSPLSWQTLAPKSNV